MSERVLAAWQLAVAVTGSLILGLAAMWGMIQTHADTTHAGAVTVREFSDMKQRLERIEDKLDRALER